MSTTRSSSAESGQLSAIDHKSWKKQLPYLFTMTVPNVKVRQTVHENERVKDTSLLLITRSDGIHKIGYLPNEQKDTRLEDGSEARQAYLCKLGSILSAKAGMSSGGNKANDAVWDALPEILFGYEIFERARDKVVGIKASDTYVVGHPIEGGVEGLFRTAEEFAEHLLWLAEGDEKKECACVLCTKEAKRQAKKASSGSREEAAEAWRKECNDRAKSYMSSTTLGSLWGNLPDLDSRGEDADMQNE